MMKHRVWVGLIGILFTTACISEPEQTTEYTEDIISASAFLLSVQEVNARLNRSEDIVVFEISKQEKYAQGHLPKAQRLWRPDYENHINYPYEGMAASRKQMADLMGKRGVSPNSEIIIYDTKGSVDAMRFLWIIRNYGHHKVAVMDGGKTAWEKAGFSLSKQQPTVSPNDHYRFPKPEIRKPTATIEEVLEGIVDTNVIVIDTREPEEFLGKPYIHNGEVLYYKKGAFINGCIPGAIHINWSDAVELNTNHCFKSIRALRYNFTKKGITPDKKIITYCQSGVRSAHTTFVLSDLLGFPDVINYDGSWIEWSYFYQKNRAIPIEQHTSPTAVAEEYKRLELALGQ